LQGPAVFSKPIGVPIKKKVVLAAEGAIFRTYLFDFRAKRPETDTGNVSGNDPARTASQFG
jgi:hypothetical protein